ncbi:unnamed protein product, partial [Symbiodinium sp. CCMP2456]
REPKPTIERDPTALEESVCREDVGLLELEDGTDGGQASTRRRAPWTSDRWAVVAESDQPLDIELAEQLVADSISLGLPDRLHQESRGQPTSPAKALPVEDAGENKKVFREHLSHGTTQHSVNGEVQANEDFDLPFSHSEENVANLPFAAHSSDSFQVPHRIRSKSKGSDSCGWNLACLGSACGSSAPASEACEVKAQRQLARANEGDFADPERSWSPLCNSNEPHSPRALADLKKELEDTIYTFQIVVEKFGKKLGLAYDDSDGECLVIKNINPGVLYDSIYKHGADKWVHIEDRIVAINSVRGKSELLEQEIMRSDVIHITLQRPKPPRGVHYFCVDPENPTVTVHAYDLFGHGRGPLACVSRTINAVSTRFGLFHTGVEVYGQEWYFGANMEGLFHGVQPMDPKQHPVHRYRCSVILGRTEVTPEAFEELLPLVRMKWPSWSYHAMSRNCHSFSDFFCRMLGFPSAPKFGLFGCGDEHLCIGGGAITDARSMVRNCSFTGCMSMRSAEGRLPTSPTMRDEVHSTPVVPQLRRRCNKAHPAFPEIQGLFP